MKKNLYFVALAVSMLASCANEESVQLSQPSGSAIGFQSFVGKSTRDDATNANLSSIYVYGGKSDSDFNAVNVTNDGNGNWSYSPLRYWEEGKDYSFAAVAPQVDEVAYNKENKTLTINDYSAGDDDLIIALTGDFTGQEKGNNSNVSLNFKHALSRVQFKFVGDPGTQISNVKLLNVNSVGSVVATYDAAATTFAWTSSTPQTMDVNLTEEIGVKYLVPQTISAEASMTFTMTTDGEAEQKSVKILNSTVTAWEPGKSYNYRVNYSGDAINFEVVGDDWQSGYESSTGSPEDYDGYETKTTVLVPTADLQVRNNGTYVNNDKMEINNNPSKSDGALVMNGLLKFDLPSDLKKDNLVKVELRLVSVQIKGNNTINIYEFSEDFTDESKSSDLEYSKIENALKGNVIQSFEAKGKGNTALGSTGNNDQLTEDYLTVADWTNLVDLTEFVSGKLDSQVSSVGFLIGKDKDENQGIKFATKESTGITHTAFANGVQVDGNSLTFKADDLKPQLTITYKVKSGE